MEQSGIVSILEKCDYIAYCAPYTTAAVLSFEQHDPVGQPLSVGVEM